MLRIFLVIGLCLAQAAWAQDRKPSHCIAIAEAAPQIQFAGRWPAMPERLYLAAGAEGIAEYSVRLRYLSHSSYLLETHGGLRAITDFTGYVGRQKMIPDVVTMNHAHSSHWTAHPDPAVPHVLRGWGEEFGAGIDHYLDLGEMLVRNVSTDIRSQFGGREDRGNSIFVFEVAGLCIGHLGHLHHEPNDEQYAALGRLDVVMAPVDGGMTLELPAMIRVLKRLKSSVVLPMHWFSSFSLGRFVSGMEDEFAVVYETAPFIDVSLATLPRRPSVVILQPSFIEEFE